jgi:hypothetical protein
MKISTLQHGRHLACAALFLAVLLIGGNASAANVLRFLPDQQTVDASAGSVQVDLQMEFDDTTLGGGIQLAFDDAILGLPTITFDAALGDDADFRCPLDTNPTCPSDPLFASWGTFGGLTGAKTVLSLVLPLLAEGSTQLSASIVNEFSDSGGTPLDVTIVPAAITVVPEPSTGLLLALGLTGLALPGRRSRA